VTERKKLRIGELLVEHGLLEPFQLENALSEQRSRGKKLGQVLVEMEYVGEEQLLDFLATQLDVPFLDLSQLDLDPEVVGSLPETHARRFRAVVYEATDTDCAVAMADPGDIFGTDELVRILKRNVRPALARERDILDAIECCYGNREEIKELAQELREELFEGEDVLAELANSGDELDAPVARLLNSLFEDAVRAQASDIHIEPDESVLRIRQRVDGVLQEQVMSETRIAPALVLRLKLMAGLDISEKRLPQDGRFEIKVSGRAVDVRLSTMPIACGESVVMRLLDQSSKLLELGQLGLPRTLLDRLRRLGTAPHGLILVTGPTGSGKTTTLYGLLRELNRAERKIITVEDPVEYRLPRINQVQVNAKIDLTFARVLRSALRQDPDVLMVGEMRDNETAEIGLRAAMTGHLVLSTLHTNDAISSGFRLIDMGVEGYLAAAALRAVISQRLVRKICEHCRQPAECSAQELAWLRQMAPKIDPGDFESGRGCTQCFGTGYRGRLGVYEILEADEPMADALRRNDASAYTHAARANPGYQPLAVTALAHARARRTTLSEVIRVSESIEAVADPPPSRAKAPRE
jgi:MSHA biogenesis protein MshE